MAQITITLNVPDQRVSDLWAGFLRMRPIPTDEDGEPLYASNAQWLEVYVKAHLKQLVRSGQRDLAAQGVTDVDVT